MNKVMDGIYISDCFAASDEKELLKNVRIAMTNTTIENYPHSERFKLRHGLQGLIFLKGKIS